VIVLLVKVSVPARVANVPDVGNVTEVVPVTVTVVPNEPDMVNVLAALFATPVPPLAAPSIPVTPVVNGKPETLVSVPLEGVPKAPPLTTTAPAVPTLTAKAVATLVPKPLTPVLMGTPVILEPEPEKVVAVTVPFTSRAVEGAVLPIPTLPALVIRIFSVGALAPSGVVEKTNLAGISLVPGVPSTTTSILAASIKVVPSSPVLEMRLNIVPLVTIPLVLIAPPSDLDKYTIAVCAVTEFQLTRPIPLF
jgi:hypothetical protein